ncbi:hypothetical protein B0O99DRAFT_697590 [Bisporella sp. PMI_857]|nr:hypothetical protein B0O99DRAFT_697590 [Bisporella sp. PMI_857]
MPPRQHSPQPSELSESPLLYEGPIETNASLANNLNGFSVSLERQEQWLRRSQQWDFADLPVRWVPRKVLGAGVNGIAALFERRGDGQGPTELVVKQSARNSELMRWESLTMRLCMQAESEHIVKLYKAFYRAEGTGVGPFDPLPIDLRGRYDRSREVSRIYTEYCRNGNMRGLSNYDDLGETFPEEYIWRFVLCLSKALMVLEYGSEDMSTDWETKIVHFDIKEDNSKLFLFGKRELSKMLMRLSINWRFGVS